MSVAFGVRDYEGVGTSPSDMRHILDYLWTSTGVVGGLAVSGTDSLAYDVAEGLFIAGRTTGYGKTQAYFEGGQTPEVSANTSSYARYDVVWIRPHDVETGEEDNLVVVGVTEGTPAASPTRPSIPTGSYTLMVMSLPAGATTTAAATRVASVNYAIPYGVSQGVLLNKTNTGNGVMTSTTTVNSGTVNLATDRFVNIQMMVTGVARGGQATDGEGSVYVDVLVDGSVVVTFEVRMHNQLALSQFFQFSQNLAAGSHTIAMRYRLGAMSGMRFYYSKGGHAGQKLQVLDGGVVR